MCSCLTMLTILQIANQDLLVLLINVLRLKSKKYLVHHFLDYKTVYVCAFVIIYPHAITFNLMRKISDYLWLRLDANSFSP